MVASLLKIQNDPFFLSFIDRILGHDSRLNSFGLMDHDVDYHTFAWPTPFVCIIYVCENVWSWHRTVMSSKNMIKSCNFIFVEFRNFRFNWVLASPLIFVIASWKHQYIYYLYVRDNGIKNWFFLAIYTRVNEM